MPMFFLKCGTAVLADEEDLELLSAPNRSWFIYRNQPSQKRSVAWGEKRHNRMFRIQLHREVAIRTQPELVGRKFRVLPRNGDFLDCRRENLEVVLAKPRRGRPPVDPRPVGWLREPVRKPRFDVPPASSLWAGGYIYKAINRDRFGEGFRVRKCLGGKPVD